jgi:hypothetical protein
VVGTYLPNLAAALAILIVGWFVALLIAWLVRAAVRRLGIDKYLSRSVEVDGEGEAPDVSRTIGRGVFWVVMLIVGVAFFQALKLTLVTEPLQAFLNQVFEYAPRFIAAGVVLFVAWIVANLLAAAGADRLSERVGLTRIMADKKLSDVLGLLVYVLILVPVIVGSLNALQIEAVTKPASDMLNTILASLPGIFAAVLVVGVAYVVGRVVSGMAASVLNSVGFDKLPARLGIAAATPEGGRTPSQIAGVVIMVAIVLFATMQALPMLGFDLLAGMMSDFLGFAARVLVSLVIFGFGLYFAKLVADLIRDSGIANAALLSHVARIAILVLAVAMGVQQIGLAKEVVNLAFGITLGAVAVAAAVAFGIGGRDAAKKLIDEFVERRRQARVEGGRSD